MKDLCRVWMGWGRGTTLKNEEMGIMSALKASALLHLPEDVKKEFNGTIGYS